MSLSPIIGAASQVLNLFSKSSAKPDLSEAAELFSNLQNVAQTGGAQFKQLAAQISSQLQSAAQTASSSGHSALSQHHHAIVSAAQSAYEQSAQTDI